MNGSEKAFPIIKTGHDIDTGVLKHWVSSDGGLTKREFAIVMLACGFIANGRPWTSAELKTEVDKTMNVT